MTIKKKSGGKLFGKFLLLIILGAVGGAAFLAMQDTPPPTKTVTKTIQNPNLQ